MLSVAMILTAASLATAPPVSLKLSPSPHILAAAARGEGGCGPQFDPQFVHYVPPAPAAGHDGLFRLISSPASQTNDEALFVSRRTGCVRMGLTRYAPPH